MYKKTRCVFCNEIIHTNRRSRIILRERSTLIAIKYFHFRCFKNKPYMYQTAFKV